MNCFMSLRHFFSDVFSIMKLMFADDGTYEVIAWGAAVAVVSAFIIQTVRILISKSVSGISSYMYIMYSFAFAGWFTYGVHIESVALIVSNLIIFFFTFLILLLILYYDEEDKIERKYRDPLTRVYNKKYFEEKVPLLAADSLVLHKPFSVVAFKIANLEKINKELGSKYVNRALRALARSLDRSLRETDVIARTDDNLFEVFLCGAEKPIAETVIARLQESFAKVTIMKGKKSMGIDVLGGVCTWEHSDNLSEFGAKAEEALEKASMKKGQRIKFYEGKIVKKGSKKTVASKKETSDKKEVKKNDNVVTAEKTVEIKEEVKNDVKKEEKVEVTEKKAKPESKKKTANTKKEQKPETKNKTVKKAKK